MLVGQTCLDTGSANFSIAVYRDGLIPVSNTTKRAQGVRV